MMDVPLGRLLLWWILVRFLFAMVKLQEGRPEHFLDVLLGSL